MTSNAIKFAAISAVLVLAAGTFSSLSQAQPVYRIVGPDGKVTFSDKPPPAASNAKVTAAGADGARGVATASLPFELRKVVGQYPVTLYSGENCGPCASARSLLTTRGVPFAEKTIATNEDAQALQRISGDNSLPFLTIGSQQLKGFSDAEWTQFLDAAGYPKSSVLPASYRQAPATPLVTVAPTPAPATTAAARPGTPVAPSTPVTPPPSNPAGIRF
ncbi:MULTISPECIES: glutaredoxin domain-containing protein [unclassified Polaromonas]|jgi:glutaredoxin|uniref:glutaredoxin domain-containing protein n=1 Tax=unclassified Polaromonas TaxID=2638319 RepID=UPI000BDD75D7|nr:MULTISPECIES: glutaredoxin domain-containing protein [unclassified Polaromonas]OYY34561.1 MAG: NrdH-redoxin [Polaromonas sp. 35-63-35]OYZ18887.1 MAG: NrdH-redoxin [Polaromonas sp. 16-63-31]OYZ78879.1 MAG: NrdH-redoxin [Polaromonas sp. 24-63-21]OZA49606.1 MAG: NrdH-redoxin [Polaromonas sp. 17-63-33]OZA86851.1 MAG: NrdH-redoxin [Polaromonas sp. 39-63-25]